MVVLDIKVKEDIDISNIPTINKQVFLFFFYISIHTEQKKV